MCGDGARVILFYARVINQLGFSIQKVQANVVYCYVRRRAEYTSLGPGLEHLSQRADSSLVAQRRAVALHVVFLSTKHPHDDLLLLCVLSCDKHSCEKRALGAPLFLVSRCEPASTDS